MANDTVRIQLGGRRGKPVRGYAIVDAIDADLAQASWHLNRGYARRTLDGINVLFLHRAVTLRAFGRVAGRGEHTDHINGDKLDNRRSNLRIVACSQNGQNRSGLNANNRSGYRGVCWSSQAKKWRGKVRLNRRDVHCGFFTTADAASAAVATKRKELGFLDKSLAPVRIPRDHPT